ncbi:MAG TPA: DinB family protein [Candidatus Sulfotelmatobacter sp.]|nr:DinB family protein [Candidatus Sulfotelmatobacter sp.]
MTKDDIILLYRYDRWANRRILEAVSTLSDEQFIRDLAGSFPSVRNTLAHILGGAWIWLAYWKQPPQSTDQVAELRKRRDAVLAPEKFPNAASLRAKWSEVEKELTEFVDGVTDTSLQQPLPFRDTKIALGFLMQHLANHSTYHRGQVALMLRQLGSQAPATDFHEFLKECVLT